MTNREFALILCDAIADIAKMDLDAMITPTDPASVSILNALEDATADLDNAKADAYCETCGQQIETCCGTGDLFNGRAGQY